MPERVPVYVLIRQLLNRVLSLLKTGLRGITVVIIWLIVLPNFTLWTWRFYFWSGENIGFYTQLNEEASHVNTTINTETQDDTSFIISQLK
jgi:hypothetical protein